MDVYLMLFLVWVIPLVILAVISIAISGEGKNEGHNVAYLIGFGMIPFVGLSLVLGLFFMLLEEYVKKKSR
jgi:hypothetical protein